MHRESYNKNYDFSFKCIDNICLMWMRFYSELFYSALATHERAKPINSCYRRASCYVKQHCCYWDTLLNHYLIYFLISFSKLKTFNQCIFLKLKYIVLTRNFKVQLLRKMHINVFGPIIILVTNNTAQLRSRVSME